MRDHFYPESSLRTSTSVHQKDRNQAKLFTFTSRSLVNVSSSPLYICIPLLPAFYTSSTCNHRDVIKDADRKRIFTDSLVEKKKKKTKRSFDLLTFERSLFSREDRTREFRKEDRKKGTSGRMRKKVGCREAQRNYA